MKPLKFEGKSYGMFGCAATDVEIDAALNGNKAVVFVIEAPGTLGGIVVSGTPIEYATPCGMRTTWQIGVNAFDVAGVGTPAPDWFARLLPGAGDKRCSMSLVIDVPDNARVYSCNTPQSIEFNNGVARLV